MATILDADLWVKIPAGEATIGLSQQQRGAIAERLYEIAYSKSIQHVDKELLRRATEKLKQFPRKRLSKEERSAFRQSLGDSEKFMMMEEVLTSAQPERMEFLEEFYLSRFPITEEQEYRFTHGVPADQLPGVLDEPELMTIEVKGERRQVMGRQVAALRISKGLQLVEALGGRLPTEIEWEKAARGTDGRLYPWGDEWDETRGFFYYGQEIQSDYSGRGRAVTAFPEGASPYGVEAMAGGLPELVEAKYPRPALTSRVAWRGGELLVGVRGAHARESTKEFGWFDHIVALPGQGMWAALRPALDTWPRQQWRGHRAGEAMEKQVD